MPSDVLVICPWCTHAPDFKITNDRVRTEAYPASSHCLLRQLSQVNQAVRLLLTLTVSCIVLHVGEDNSDSSRRLQNTGENCLKFRRKCDDALAL